jgi:hypothetical protein
MKLEFTSKKDYISRKFICGFIKKIFEIGKNMPAPPVIKTIAQIIIDLNAEGRGTWVELNGYYVLSVPKISGKKFDFNFPEQGMILKAFWNSSSGEIRTYAAKNLDIPNREDFW